MRIILKATALAMLMGCSQNDARGRYPTPASLDTEDSRLVDEISNRVFLQLHKENKHLYPIECGGSMMDQIKLLHWGFDYFNDINIAQSRELLVSASTQFLKAFNEDERIRPYLATYPFTPENIEIRIFMLKPDGSLRDPDELHVISMLSGKLQYKTGRSDSPLHKTVLKETYEEAVMKLTNAAQSDDKIDDKR